MSKTASHAQKATQYFKIQACGATKWSRMPGFLEYLNLHDSLLTPFCVKCIIVAENAIRAFAAGGGGPKATHEHKRSCA